MTFSMTGYGRGQQVLHGRDIMVEIKSVNSRYFEYFSRLPRNCSYLDDPLKKAVSALVGRGKVELHLSIQNVDAGEMEVKANTALAAEYYSAIVEMSRSLGVHNDVTASVLARFNDIFTLKQRETDEGELLADVLAVAALAVQRLNEMRAAEGEKLAADIQAHMQEIESLLTEVEADSLGRVQRYTSRLHERLREVLQDNAVEEARLLLEAAVFADKTCVDEETVRLHSHLKQYGEIIAGGSPMGRKLDFLTQEINREVNTIGSKCQELDITRRVVDMKAEVEKIREQIQNLE